MIHIKHIEEIQYFNFTLLKLKTVHHDTSSNLE